MPKLSVDGVIIPISALSGAFLLGCFKATKARDVLYKVTQYPILPPHFLEIVYYCPYDLTFSEFAK